MLFVSPKMLFDGMSKKEVLEEIENIKIEIKRLEKAIKDNVPCPFDMDWKGQQQIQQDYLNYANKLLKKLK